MNDNIEEKVDEVFALSEVESCKTDISKVKSLNLLNFIQAQIDKAISKNTLKDSVIDQITSRMGSKDEELNNVELIKLLEILSKGDNEFAASLLNSITNLYKISKDEDDSSKTKSNESKDTPVTASDMKAFTEMVKIFKKLQLSELPETLDEED